MKGLGKRKYRSVYRKSCPFGLKVVHSNGKSIWGISNSHSSKPKQSSRPASLRSPTISPFWNTKPLPRDKYRSGLPVNLFGDKDKDGVDNVFDCRPRNPKKQGLYHLPMSKKGYVRTLKQKYPIVARSKRGDYVEVLSKKGITHYNKSMTEKLADVQKEHPTERYSVQSQMEMEQGSARGVIAKGRTPGRVIFRQTGYKKAPEWDPYRKEEKVKQLSIVDTSTGDIEQFQETSKFTKKQMEKEREEAGVTDEWEKSYHPSSELSKLQESEHIEVLNPSPVDTIREKRESLRDAARDMELDTDYPDEGTVKAFKEVTEEPSAQDLVEESS